jgi:hypothetical protein
VLILCNNTTERVALPVGQLSVTDNIPDKAALLCHMLMFPRPDEVVRSFTRSKLDPRAVKIGRKMSGTTYPTYYLSLGGRPSYSRPKRNCSDLE